MGVRQIWLQREGASGLGAQATPGLLNASGLQGGAQSPWRAQRRGAASATLELRGCAAPSVGPAAAGWSPTSSKRGPAQLRGRLKTAPRQSTRVGRLGRLWGVIAREQGARLLACPTGLPPSPPPRTLRAAEHGRPISAVKTFKGLPRPAAITGSHVCWSSGTQARGPCPGHSYTCRLPLHTTPLPARLLCAVWSSFNSLASAH